MLDSEFELKCRVPARGTLEPAGGKLVPSCSSMGPSIEANREHLEYNGFHFPGENYPLKPDGIQRVPVRSKLGLVAGQWVTVTFQWVQVKGRIETVGMQRSKIKDK